MLFERKHFKILLNKGEVHFGWSKQDTKPWTFGCQASLPQMLPLLSTPPQFWPFFKTYHVFFCISFFLLMLTSISPHNVTCTVAPIYLNMIWKIFRIQTQNLINKTTKTQKFWILGKFKYLTNPTMLSTSWILLCLVLIYFLGNLWIHFIFICKEYPQ